jgi:hypothetical protein
MQVPVSQPFHTELNWGSHWRFSTVVLTDSDTVDCVVSVTCCELT